MMKTTFIALFTLIAGYLSAQELNLKKGAIAEGYDVVAYFSGEAVEGEKGFTATHAGGTYRFSSQANLDTFKANPDKYVPQYGGWCAYAMGDSGELVDINPKRYEIRDGKLFLFYDAFGIDTLEKWLEEGTERLKSSADANWAKHVEQGK